MDTGDARHPDGSGGPSPGDRPTVLLVHGYPDTHTVWGPLATQLLPDHRVVAYDVRGAGASTAPSRRSGYRLDALVDDLVAVLDWLDAGSHPVHLVAHDWGSIQSWHAVTDPRLVGQVASYTSISGPCLDHVAHWMRAAVRSRSPRRWAQVAGQLARSWYVGFFHLPALAPAAWRLGLARVLPRALRRLEGIEPTGRTPGDRRADRGRRGAAGASGARSGAGGSGVDGARGSAEPRVEEGAEGGGSVDPAVAGRTGVPVRPAGEPEDPWPAPTLAADGHRGVQLYRANFLPRLLRPEERRTDVPVQVIVPTRDRYVSPALFQDLDRWVGRLRVHEVVSGHWVVRTDPELIAAYVRELAAGAREGTIR